MAINKKNKKINKTAIFLIALFVALTAVCAICMTALGRSYTYNIKAGIAKTAASGPDIVIENEGIVSVKEISDDKIVFDSVSEGQTTVTLVYTADDGSGSLVEISLPIKLCVSPSGVIINQTDIDFNGYTIVVYAAFVYLVAVLVCVIMSAKKTLNENFYSYKSILYVGLFIFIVFLLLTLIIQMSAYWAYGADGLYTFISTIAYSADNIVILLLPVIAVIFILISISNVVLLKREGIKVNNVLGVILGVLFIAASFAGILINHFSGSANNSLSAGYMIVTFIRIFLSFLVIYVDCIFLAACICAGFASKRKVSNDKDFVIILGCGIKKDGTLTPLLQGRTDRAMNFAKSRLKETGKRCIIIPSGGKGPDEIISEGEAMKNYLLEHNVPNEDILVENRAANTFENITFSKRLADSVMPNAKLAFATTNYHLFRSGLIANEAGIKIDGIGSKTKWYFWPNAFLREFVGVMKYEIKYHIAAAAIIFIVSLALIIGCNLLL